VCVCVCVFLNIQSSYFRFHLICSISPVYTKIMFGRGRGGSLIFAWLMPHQSSNNSLVPGHIKTIAPTGSWNVITHGDDSARCCVATRSNGQITVLRKYLLCIVKKLPWLHSGFHSIHGRRRCDVAPSGEWKWEVLDERMVMSVYTGGVKNMYVFVTRRFYAGHVLGEHNKDV